MQQGLDIVVSCPLGGKCEEIKDDKIHRCAWYVDIEGKHPQTDEQIKESKCAMAWMPILQVEVAGTNRGQTAALESFRNESVKGQQEFNSMFKGATQQRLE